MQHVKVRTQLDPTIINGYRLKHQNLCRAIKGNVLIYFELPQNHDEKQKMRQFQAKKGYTSWLITDISFANHSNCIRTYLYTITFLKMYLNLNIFFSLEKLLDSYSA